MCKLRCAKWKIISLKLSRGDLFVHVLRASRDEWKSQRRYTLSDPSSNDVAARIALARGIR